MEKQVALNPDHSIGAVSTHAIAPADPKRNVV